MAKPGRDDHRTRRAELARLIDKAGDRCRRRGDHHEFRHERQLAQAADRGNAIDFGIMRIHQAKVALEFRVANVPEHGTPDGALARACPDQRKRTGRKQIFQAIG
jgi:hypothetical protein